MREHGGQRLGQLGDVELVVRERQARFPGRGGTVAVDEEAAVPDRSDFPAQQRRARDGQRGEVEQVLRDGSLEEGVVLDLPDQLWPPPVRERERELREGGREERERGKQMRTFFFFFFLPPPSSEYASASRKRKKRNHCS